MKQEDRSGHKAESIMSTVKWCASA